MPPPPFRVAVVGSGTAGPAAALHIVRRLPHAVVSIFDKAEAPRAVGAGIGIQPIGLTALKKLGLLDTVTRHGARVEGIKTRTAESGWPVLDVAYERFDRRLFGLGLHRGVLFEALLEACHAADRVTCNFGIDINDLEQIGDTVTIRGGGGGSSSSSSSGGASGATFGPYDLVVVADGTASKLRPLLRIPSWFKQYEYGALFGLLPDEQRTFGRTLTQVHSGPGCHTTLGFLPTGMPWGHGVDTAGDGVIDTHAEFVTTLYYNVRLDDAKHTSLGMGGGGGGSSDASLLREFKDECAALCPEAEALLEDGLVDQQQLALARYSDGAMWRFNRGRVVVIGDAAHSMSPQLGQGCNLALIDAEKLADAVVGAFRGELELDLEREGAEEEDGHGGKDKSSSSSSGSSSVAKRRGGEGGGNDGIPAALNAYTHERWWRTQFYGAQSRFLTPLFASRSRALRALRDATMYPACHAPILSTYVHGILCGAQAPVPIPGVTIPQEEYLGFLDGGGSSERGGASK